MKALHTKKFLAKKSISDAAIPVQSPIKSRPFVADSRDFQKIKHPI
jgi:hypothetical protein